MWQVKCLSIVLATVRPVYMCALLQVRSYIFEVAGQVPLQVDIVSGFWGEGGVPC
jgi:hypothetical protein